MVFTDNFTPTTTTTTTSPPPHEPDDISAFLRQLLHRSSSSSSSSSSVFLPSTTTVEMHANAPGNSKSSLLTAFTTTNNVFPTSGLFSGLDRGTHQPTTGYQTGCYPVSGGGSHLSSINDFTEDYDYESEEGAAEETEAGTGARQTRSRNQSKRTRAAEVHNLSEKRRRSRINEKMKALQNLIPNSNKTDKASMLDEAIEYLKQLQLQVQMLSMRNGMSLHPMCLPEEQGSLHATQLSQIGMHNLNNNINTPFDHLTMSSSLNIIPDTSHSAFNLANLLSSTTRPPLSTFADVINSEGTFGIDSGARPSFRPFQSQNPDPHQTVCREQSPPHERLTINKHEMNSLVTTMPPSFGAGNSIVEENHNPRDAHTPTKYASQELLLENILGQNPRSSSLFSGLHAASSSAQNDKLATGR